jgi:predicted nucleotidyltransferase
LSEDSIEQFLLKFTNWAFLKPDILALAVVGSHARGAATPASDLDLVLICANPALYLQNTDWAQQFGVVEKQQVEEYGLVTSLRVWYKDGPEVEFGLTDERWAALPLDEGTRRVIADGMRVVFEKDKILSRHQAATR